VAKNNDLRLSRPALKVLHLFMTNSRDELSGSEISKQTGVGAGTLYPMLARFEATGWLRSKWEDVEANEVGRPRRRFYTLTGVGYRAAKSALTELQAPTGRLAWT
jgi:DNA-binding PadR family transcriptional regulator